MSNDKHFSSFFIHRPITTTLLMLSLIIFGIFAYFKLPVNDLPNIDFPTIEVTANLPGASPDTMASSVALPLEKEFSTIDGITSMISNNTKGQTRITIQFRLERDIDAAAQDVQAMISKALRNLPQDLSSPPSLRKVNPADLPIFYLAITSKTLPLYKVHEYADLYIAQQISSLPGVAQVNIFGSQKYAVRIDLKPEKIYSLGLSFDEIATTIRKNNPKLPTGALYTSTKNYVLETTSKPQKASDFEEITIKTKDTMQIKLKEVADVYDSVENNKVASWYKDTRAIVLAIQRQPGSNTIEIVDNIKQMLPKIKTQLPGSIDVNVLYDRTIPIRESVEDVKFTLVLTIALVIMVIFIFLRNLRATLIPSFALPISLIGTFATMYLLGFSINNLSLLALTLSVGFVVDDAIVVLENIFRHLEMGKKPLEAAIDGTKEIYFTIISMTLSLVAVFIPVLFMKGILGRLLNEFAITISFAILISGIVSLTLTPMLSSRFLKHHHLTHNTNPFNRFFDRIFSGMFYIYRITLLKVIQFRKTVIVFFITTTIFTVYLFIEMPLGFLPNDDVGQLFIVTEAQPGTTFEQMASYHKKISNILLQDENIDGFMSSIGAGGASSSENSGRFFITLKDRKYRKMNAEKVAASLRKKLSSITGIKVFVQNPPPIRLGGRLTKSQYQLTLTGSNTEELYSMASIMEEKLGKLALIQNVTSDLEIKNPQISISIIKEKADLMGISIDKIEQALQLAFSEYQVSTIYAPDNQYKVILGVGRSFQNTKEKLQNIYIPSANKLIQLSSIVEFKETLGPISVNHLGQMPAVTISFDLRDGVALGDAVKKVEEIASNTLPANISSSFQGTAEAFKASTEGLWLLILFAVIVIYIVLGILYESFIHPLTILSGLPSAGLGAILVLKLFGYDLNVYGFVGLIMLLGIVKKNAIMMIDFALDAERNRNLSPLVAITEGALIRFRPIMMTTFAALMGAIPIAIGIGASAEARKSLGIAIVGGLLVSQLVTLYITPVIYYYLDKISKKM
ncbi:MAG: efflux RND transporter permease subunit [Calditerrivibrio sp.]|nr:efflux RND transporter permease subunit [Calditerrivibrio sp.]